MTGTKLATAAAAALALFILAVAVIAGGPVASSEQPPAGGCAISPNGTPINGPAGSTNGTASGTGGSTGSGTGSGGVPQKDATLNANQMAAARAIAGVGKAMGIAERGVAIALGTAMQESTMDPNAVNGRSVGLFQQQGALYGQIDRRDPPAAARAFYTQLVARVPNYADPASGAFADIAQRVQESGAGASKYAPWERWATALAAQLITGGAPGPDNADGDVRCEAGGGSGPIPVARAGRDVTLPAKAGIDSAGSAVVIRYPNEKAAIAAAAALSYLGTPYAWGGGGPNGPSPGIRDGGVADRHGDFLKVGFDCSGLTEYAWAQAGVSIGGDSRSQYAHGGTKHRFAQARPGDLLFIGDTPPTIHHVALYLGRIYGREYVVESPHSGSVVKVSSVLIPGNYRTEVVRPWE